MTKNGNVAQLIVKRRDSKSHPSSSRSENNSQFKSLRTRSVYYDWLPEVQHFFPNIIRMDSYDFDKNASEYKAKNIWNDSDKKERTLQIPKPVTIQSSEISLKPSQTYKKGRSLTEIDYDGIPIVHGVRVPDDETDKKVWRNARVINGELIPYEDGYKPPAVVPLGQLIYASQAGKESEYHQGIGPFTTSDNYHEINKEKTSYGPFTVRDNVPGGKSGRNQGVGPFTVNDNMQSKLKLVDYIKEINEQESKKDYSKRKLRSYVSEPQLERRMLQQDTNSIVYGSQYGSGHVNFNEGVRTPILQYAHPELGVQPAKASSDREYLFESEERHAQPAYYTNSINNVDYYKRDVINYPYGYYIKPQIEQPFWVKITESIKSNVQNGFERMHQFTRPVIEPIVEVTNKIGHSLGIPIRTPAAEDRIGVMAPVSGSAILPALGLVAGGAALGLGAAAVGRLLQPEVSMRLMPDNNLLLIMENTAPQNDEAAHKRLRRSTQLFDDHYLQQISTIIQNDNLDELRSSRVWEDTPCSKRITCEVLVKQNPDQIILMEKKMGSLFFASQSEVLRGISYHLQEVLDAAKNGRCGEFVCTRALPIVVA